MTAGGADAAELQSLLVRQKFMSDNRDVDGLAACYAPEMELSVRFNGGEPVRSSGRDAVVDGIRAGWGDGPPTLIHFVGPAEIELLGRDTARTRSTCLYIATATGATVGWGTYDDSFVRHDNRWLLCGRELEATFLRPPPNP